MLQWVLVKMVRGYQRCVSPWLVPSCRFHPTCSEYAAQALQQFNPLKALGLTLWRLLKCHPYHEGGVDPVPVKK
ncbi:MAG: membrane protein insertion efficiency factor YidD [Nitrospinae bacterium CG11_big_fil_rev_8_21_14_0_20_56_8]|nr:MAG: membrane protein insertion efficiency factor YidD [Nitrospinae bacterium CG11_big_fil_rev_8_21_14_0_20_56_8]